jgi:hypothetical protein
LEITLHPPRRPRPERRIATERESDMFFTSINGFVPRMKTGVFALAAILTFTGPALAGQAGSSCLPADDVNHTQVLNDHQILFYMRNKKIWLNTLQARCISLPVQEGFAFSSAFSEYCPNIETIRIIRTGEVCQLGQFTPYEKPVNHS